MVQLCQCVPSVEVGCPHYIGVCEVYCRGYPSGQRLSSVCSMEVLSGSCFLCKTCRGCPISVLSVEVPSVRISLV